MYGDTILGFYHMQDFMNQYLGGNMDEECSNFVSKFDIFTKIWASTKGNDIWNNCG